MPRREKKESLVPTTTINAAVKEAKTELAALEPLPKRLKKIKMTSDESLTEVMTEGKIAKNIQRKVLASRKVLTDLCDSLKREIKNLFQPMLSECEEVLGLVDEKKIEYDFFLEKKQAEEQRIADEEAEAERKRLQKNANARARRAGSEAEAKEIRHSVHEVEARQVEKEAPVKVAGAVTAKIWDFEVFDPKKVPESIVTPVLNDPGHTSIDLWERDFFKANLKTARSLLDPDGKGQPIPGVRFFQKDSTRYGRD